MRDEQYLTVGANPIIPALGNSATGSGAVKKDNVSDTLARLNRARDEKSLSLTARTDAGTTTSPDSANSGEDSGETGFSFSDMIDILNPLQHIPGISSVYRAVTGDEISPMARVAGASLFLGPVGVAGTLIDLGVEAVTDNNIGEHLLGLFDDSSQQNTVNVAANGSATVGTSDVANIGEADSIPVSSPVPGDMPVPASALLFVQETVLSPTEAFTFAPQPATLVQPPQQANGGPSHANIADNAGEPVAPDPIPSDIFTALYSDRPAQDSATRATDAINVNDMLSRLNPSSDLGVNGRNGTNTPDPIVSPLISADMVARVYDTSGGADTLSHTMGHQAALMPEAVSRYEHPAILQRPGRTSFVDVRN